MTSPKSQETQIRIEKKEDGSFEIICVVPQKIIQSYYQTTLNELAKKTEIKGFRKGNVPPKIAEEKIGKEKIYQELIPKLLSQLYQEALRKNGLTPVIPPEINLLSAQENKDWEIKFVTCEKPEIKLNDFLEKVKETNAKTKIWTPKKKNNSHLQEKGPKEEKEKRIDEIVKLLIQNTTIKIPEALYQYEINRKLSDLIDQLQRVGLKIEQYLQSKGTTLEEIKRQYRQETEITWKLELALEEVGKENNISISEEEIKKINKESKEINPYLAAKILRREKILEFLLNL